MSTHIYLNFLLLTGILTGAAAGLSYSFGLTGMSIVLFVCILVIENLRRPAGVACIADQFDERILASVLSAESQISSVIGAILSFGIGVFADLTGPGYAIAGACFVLLLLFPMVRLSASYRNTKV